MIVLDTNILSALMLKVPDRAVVAWLDGQSNEQIWTTAITVFEIRFGLALLEKSRRQDQLQQAFESLLDTDLKGRVLDFDRACADDTATLLAQQRKAGKTIEIRDAMIAGTVRARNATLATRNVRHFTDLGIHIVEP